MSEKEEEKKDLSQEKKVSTELVIEDILKDLEVRFTGLKKLRQPYEADWYRNVSYFFGRQWVLYSDRDKRLYTPPAPSWRVRLVINLIYPAVRIILGKLSKVQFSLIAVPSTVESEDVASARVGTKLLKYFRKALDFTVMQFQIALITILFGVSYTKAYFNSNKGKKIKVKRMVPDPIPENPGNMKEVDRILSVGEIESHVCTPLDLFFDESLPTDIQKNSIIFDARARTVDYVKNTYNVEVKPEPDVYVSPVAQQIELLLNRHTTDTKTNNMTLVKEVWQKPCKEHPKGRHLIYTQDKMLFYESAMPYPFYPYVDFPYFPTFGTCYPQSPIQHSRPLQKEYNKSRSQIIEHKNLMSRGKWLIPEGCRVSRIAFTSEPGEKIYYDSRFGKPEQVDIQPMPSYIWENIAYIRNELNDVMGIHDVSQAKIPSGIKSGLAIAYLQEQDDSQLGPTHQLMQSSYAKFGQQLLAIARKYYKEPRILNITGRQYEAEAMEFKGSMLRDTQNVECEVGSMMPFSKVARQNFIVELFEKQLIPDRNKALRMLEFSTEEDVYEDNRLDEANAQVEDNDMDNGIVHKVQPWDSHAVHMKIHITRQKDRDFTKIPKVYQDMHLTHYKEHEELQQAELEKFAKIQALRASMMGGASAPQR